RAEGAKLGVIGSLQGAHERTFQAEAARAARALVAAGLAAPATARRSARNYGRLWVAAAAAWDALGEPYPLALALRGAAGADRPKGGRARGAAPLTRAAAIARRAGAAPLLAEIELLARRGRIKLAADKRGAACTDRFGLTPRESEVLRLVAEGLSNA